MVSYEAAILSWCSDTWRQEPVSIEEWVVDEGFAQVFIRLKNSVLIVDFILDTNGDLICQNHLHIPQERWNPGSIQVFRTNEGKVRFRHRNSEIILAAHFRAPEWGQSLLEEWLMSQRGEVMRPKDKTQRIAAIKRNKESIKRNLNSASLDSAIIEIQIVSHRLESAETGLNPHKLIADESE
tara:strand:+ start:1590 stop:2135 length:546 start_codon:yes stop_codon:yes gene_type:complete